MAKALPKDHNRSYSETCNTIRHYSGLGYQVRFTTIVQGLVLLGIWTVAHYQGASGTVLVLVSCGGIIFTLSLFLFYHGYHQATKYYSSLAAEMEITLFDHPFRPVSSYEMFRTRKYSKWYMRSFILYIPFILIGVIFCTCLLVTLIS